MSYGDVHAGQTVYAIVTDHPDYPKVVREGHRPYTVYTDRDVADHMCATWNSYYGNTPQPWPFYVLETVVLAIEDRALADDGPRQDSLFEDNL